MKNLIFWFALCLPPLFAGEIVHNDGKGAGYSLTLTEEVRFGADNDDTNYLWSSGNTKILPGPNGQMFIFDPDGQRVLAFDENGTFIKQVTGPGNGPGELQVILCVSMDKAGNIYVVDTPPNGNNATIKVFHPDMSFSKQMNTLDLGYQPGIVQISPDGKLLGGMFYKLDMASQGIQLLFGILDLEARKMIHEFYKFPVPIPDATRISDPNMWIDYIAEQFKLLTNFNMFTFDGAGNAYSAVSRKYQIQQWTPRSTKPNRTIERTYKPLSFSSEARARLLDHFEENIPSQMRPIITRRVLDKAMEKADLPPDQWPLFAMVPLEDKGLLVVHDMNTANRTNLVDVFDTKGKYLCQVTMKDYAVFAYSTSNPYPRMVTRGGKAYTIETDEDGENYAVRYSYQLKAP